MHPVLHQILQQNLQHIVRAGQAVALKLADLPAGRRNGRRRRFLSSESVLLDFQFSESILLDLFPPGQKERE
jgi:hypothetical protein